MVGSQAGSRVRTARDMKNSGKKAESEEKQNGIEVKTKSLRAIHELVKLVSLIRAS